jgi:hypothetical protein
MPTGWQCYCSHVEELEQYWEKDRCTENTMKHFIINLESSDEYDEDSDSA